MARDDNGVDRDRRSSGPGRAGAAASGRGRPSTRGARSDTRPDRSRGRSDAPTEQRSGDVRRRRDDDRPDRPAASRDADRQVYDGPPIDDDVVATDLDKHVRRSLGSLPDRLADRVARHLVMAGRLVEDDSGTAYQHALAARARATRVAVVREAVGETAYAAGKYAEALAELRAAKRMNGAWDYLPMMADCERALGRPARAIAMDTAQAREKLEAEGQAELSIVVAGARRDLGQVEAAVRLLELEPLHTKSRGDWVMRLRYAYADALLAAGRRSDALEWFHRTVAVDGNQYTDAAERVRELEQDSDSDSDADSDADGH